MTLDDLTVNCQHLDRASLLVDWHWLIGQSNVPVLVTVAGDAFVQDEITGVVSFLDVTEGKIEEVAGSGDAFQALLADTSFVMNKFSVNLVAPLLKTLGRPAHGRLFSFKTPPVLGGTFDTGNLEEADVEVHFSFAGQVWAKVIDLPEGTPITDIRIE